MFWKIVSLILTLTPIAAASGKEAGASSPAPDARSMTFTLDWPAQSPPHYSITLASDGTASYVGPALNSSPGDEPYKLQWTLSEELRTQIFALAKEANYLEGKTESKLKVAKTGEKTLSFKDPAHQTSLSYNYSDDKSIQELTSIFLAIATTIHSGEKLEHQIRFDRLGLNAELKALQQQQRLGQAMEIQAILPILQKIANDRALLNLAQQRAADILKTAGLPIQREGQPAGG